jgi:twitching motility protein PilI
MTAGTASGLRSLKEHPFDLLREMERRSKAAIAGAAGDDVENVEEWVGIAVRLADEHFIVARDAVREILMMPSAVTRVPGANTWIKGLANVRGHLLSIVDLRAFLGNGTSDVGRAARVLVLNSSEFPVALMVDEVFGFRRFLEREHNAAVPEMTIRCEQYLKGSYHRGDDNWPVFDVMGLLQSDDFRCPAAG